MLPEGLLDDIKTYLNVEDDEEDYADRNNQWRH